MVAIKNKNKGKDEAQKKHAVSENSLLRKK